jgi:hypothetical protein
MFRGNISDGSKWIDDEHGAWNEKLAISNQLVLKQRIVN